jgi:hypothetical protein
MPGVIALDIETTTNTDGVWIHIRMETDTSTHEQLGPRSPPFELDGMQVVHVNASGLDFCDVGSLCHVLIFTSGRAEVRRECRRARRRPHSSMIKVCWRVGRPARVRPLTPVLMNRRLVVAETSGVGDQNLNCAAAGCPVAAATSAASSQTARSQYLVSVMRTYKRTANPTKPLAVSWD